MKLDQSRRDILTSTGHLLIEGGPGSGKTTIALLKASQTLATLKPEQKVLFLSFSRAAVRQISDSVSEQLPRDTRDRLEVRTFHAFFLDLVRAHGPLLTGTPSAFLPPDAENQVKADHDGDWDTETQELARRGVYVFDQLAATAGTLLEHSRAVADDVGVLLDDEDLAGDAGGPQIAAGHVHDPAVGQDPLAIDADVGRRLGRGRSHSPRSHTDSSAAARR